MAASMVINNPPTPRKAIVRKTDNKIWIRRIKCLKENTV
jgi:hypothetical protein